MKALRLREHVPLAPLTTLGIGGEAELFAQWQNPQELINLLEHAQNLQKPHWLLGGGSNVIIADRGLPGLVLQPAGEQIEILQQNPDLWTLDVDAGVQWDVLVQWTLAQELGGLECLSGIPGLVGSAPIQNIGAYGQEVAQSIQAVEVLNLQTGKLEVLDRDACQFGYRQSVWKQQPGRAIVTRVRMQLARRPQPCTRYAQVAEALHTEPHPTLQRVREVVLALRRQKGMVVDALDPESCSVGSFFVNPIVTPQQAETARKLERGRAMPLWPAEAGKVKLSAAWLIEHAGLQRGDGPEQRPQAPVGLSRKHTLAIVNRGGATALDVLEFANEIVRKVQDTAGIHLEREPVVLGEV